MDVPGTPFLYGGQVDPPMLDPNADALYLAVLNDTPFTGRIGLHPHHAAAVVRDVAERLECDGQYARLKCRVECRLGYGDQRSEWLHVVAACVTIYTGAQVYSINAAAACRLANRLDSGLAPEEAIRRTVEECESRPYTDAQVRNLERNADSWARELDHLDRVHDGNLGGPEHLAAIREADVRIGRP